MRTRIITALILGLALIGVLFKGPPWLLRMVFAAFIAAGAWEWAAFLGARARPLRLYYVFAIALLAMALGRYAGAAPAFRLIMHVAALWWFVALAWILLAPQRVPSWAAALAGPLALAPTWYALTRMAETWPHGRQWVFFALLLAFGADIGAYFAGRAFGRVKLAPRVSPGKTWEGVLGGMLLALGVAWGASAWFGVPASRLVPLGLLAAAFSVVGDLTESLFKRASGLKDSGTLIPGHGGVLDRIDSVLAATPILCTGLLWLGAGL